ncbi:hypothetical protein TRIUR3_08795 [Triticum urartu]|uniref:Uncharacterized protein n=1 Tax=Triticum urartu TaxID=4572 RepID=M7YGS5_TRIUA|nr:hypothetical protein TRIUR3_08795 [Triticum urartu]
MALLKGSDREILSRRVHFMTKFVQRVPEEQQQGDRLKRHLSGGAPRCGIPPPTPSHRSQSTPSRMEPCTHGSLKIPCSVKAGSQPDCWLSPWTSSVLGYHQHLDLPLPDRSKRRCKADYGQVMPFRASANYLKLSGIETGPMRNATYRKTEPIFSSSMSVPEIC